MTTSIGQTSFGQSVLQAAGLYKQPAGFTSLAFVKPQSLPERLKTNPAEISLSFSISNRENASLNYRWDLSLVQGGRTKRIADGSISVESGRSAVITRPAKVPCPQGEVRIVVSLKSPAEHIDALAACPQHRA